MITDVQAPANENCNTVGERSFFKGANVLPRQLVWRQEGRSAELPPGSVKGG
jgi:hypothetical protein